MVRRVHELRDTWAGFDFPAFRIGVGVHTGRVIAGNMGSPRRLQYNVQGAAIDIAAGIEVQTNEFHTEILISADTNERLPAKERQVLGCAELGRPAELAGVEGTREKLLLFPVRT
jgi:adenylate cyclase